MKIICCVQYFVKIVLKIAFMLFFCLTLVRIPYIKQAN